MMFFSNKTKLKFWAWIFLKARKTIHETHLTLHGNDIKCTNCKDWFSVSGIEHKHEQLTNTNESVFTSKCGKCNHITHWNVDIAPFPVLSDEKGVPLLYTAKNGVLGGIQDYDQEL